MLLASCYHNPTPVKSVLSNDQNVVYFKGTAVGADGNAIVLSARLTKPVGSGSFPALVLLHGCGGIQPKRDHQWAERLSGGGYVTLQIDSFSPRGISNTCTYSGHDLDNLLQKRVIDAYDAQRYLATLPFVDKSRIAVMGWSQGGSTTLHALHREKENPFRAAIAFYPSCRRLLANRKVPLLILIGESDDWTPASRCADMIQKENTSSEVILKVYPGAFHGFDTLGANSNIRGSRGMHHIQYDAEADADSITRVKDFWETHLR
ncbi:MAG: dienelactone hydrolase family protein [Syntrophales bacterium]